MKQLCNRKQPTGCWSHPLAVPAWLPLASSAPCSAQAALPQSKQSLTQVLPAFMPNTPCCPAAHQSSCAQPFLKLLHRADTHYARNAQWNAHCLHDHACRSALPSSTSASAWMLPCLTLDVAVARTTQYACLRFTVVASALQMRSTGVCS